MRLTTTVLCLACVACQGESVSFSCDAAPPRASVRAAAARPERAASLAAARTPPTGPTSQADDASVALLHEALASKDYATRLIDVEAIGEARLAQLAPWLGEALGDPEHDVRMAAVDSLGQLASGRTRELLASVRDDKAEDLDIRALAASALLKPVGR